MEGKSPTSTKTIEWPREWLEERKRILGESDPDKWKESIQFVWTPWLPIGATNAEER